MNIKLLCPALHKHVTDVSYIYHQSQVCYKPGHQAKVRARLWAGSQASRTSCDTGRHAGMLFTVYLLQDLKALEIICNNFLRASTTPVESTIVSVGRTRGSLIKATFLLRQAQARNRNWLLQPPLPPLSQQLPPRVVLAKIKHSRLTATRGKVREQHLGLKFILLQEGLCRGWGCGSVTAGAPPSRLPSEHLKQANRQEAWRSLTAYSPF